MLTSSESHIMHSEILSKNTVLIRGIDNYRYGWLFSIELTITKENGEEIKISVEPNPSKPYKLLLLDFNIYETEPTPPPIIYITDEISRRNGKIVMSNDLCRDNLLEFEGCDVVVVVGVVSPLVNSLIPSTKRFEQTIEQLKSIALRLPDTKIVVLEQSRSIEDDMVCEIKSYCDLLVLYGEDDDNNFYTNENSWYNKGLAEMYVSIHFARILKNINIKRMFKISGRYSLSTAFDPTVFDESIPTFKATHSTNEFHRSNIVVYTVMYVIPQSHLGSFVEHLSLWLYKKERVSIEEILTLWSESLPMIRLVGKIHVQGIVGGTGDLIYL